MDVTSLRYLVHDCVNDMSETHETQQNHETSEIYYDIGETSEPSET